MTSRFYKFGVTALSACIGSLAATWVCTDRNNSPYVVHNEIVRPPKRKRTLPPRSDQIKSLQSGEEYDVLIIGGGATGAGCALDSVTRGLKTALVEADDFASGTSSRSTKLIHGGVRYLQKAILGLDFEQYRMVKEALQERASMLESAPHLAHPLPIMLPVYQWWQVPYYWVGIKCYDLVAGDRNVKSSYYLTKKDALELFPMLKKDKLCGAIVYYDGQQDDARMCLAVALTAARHGATVCNHVEVKELLKKEENGKKVLCGAKVKDHISGKEFTVKAKCIINATGPFTDFIRKMDDPNVKTICCPSSGVHIVLPGYYSPDQMGLLDPSTSDGRVIFFLPWQRQTIAGTTDLPCDITHNPSPTEDEIQFILNEIKNYLNTDVEVRRGDVLSAWSGIRPLVSDPNKEDTQSLARNHIVHVSPSNLVTIAGGKWTTYRAMAEHTIDAAIKACSLKPERPEAVTSYLKIEGGQGWTPTMYIRLVQDFGLECEVAQHLAKSYGDRAFAVSKMASLTGKRWPIIGNRVHPEFPYIDAEIRYGVREYACTAVDMIARRLRLAFLNVQAASEALPVIVDLMGEELHWSKEEKEKQLKQANEFLAHEMGQMVNRTSKERIPIKLSKDEIQTYVKRFQLIDKDKKGYVSINDIRRALKSFGDADVSGEQLHEILREIDTNMNGQVELDEYLQMMSAIKTGDVAYSRFARMAELEEQKHEAAQLKQKISVDRSGGGL
ncbi:glycerol-3-phosphate dehydrogenase, mitochondrial [Zeugodacus cucurbitae]|uniref:Glycerol-3-phosphate dehydrogenase n=2 Tax=Zeugodacus cucurbitae TaxID=28588 RepID=A0A0A1X4X9_ZEUCU|nr:glycerol-3-phosphate dehydrogenase, mitochondrial [Zeugodacus cucurbitae]XP_011193204.1 glycerol-3-phosphate dehydrogenase, mitochondrial [Zeugodacus cucurbitae]XP_054088921.1 glycerol-3-phosphate dehydrogenase, mitochondrial [Zeugodacus cucurbitae]XP_054088922.1 glycerol-3-phosphate dehydrogenase, mitochondrial [Zeugodacus cucurbitae]